MASRWISLDWRKAPSASETINRIHRLLSDLDANSQVIIRLSETRAATSISLAQLPGKSPMVLRKDTSTLRKGAGQVLYWSRLFSMAVTISELLMDKQQVMARFVEYKEVSCLLALLHL